MTPAIYRVVEVMMDCLGWHLGFWTDAYVIWLSVPKNVSGNLRDHEIKVIIVRYPGVSKEFGTIVDIVVPLLSKMSM